MRRSGRSKGVHRSEARRTQRLAGSLGCVMLLALAARVGAQTPVSRAEAIRAATARSPRADIARVDSADATARVALARQFENPVLGALYSQSTPQAHLTLDVPIDGPWLRRPRIGAALASQQAVFGRVQFALAALRLDADTTYTRALALAQRAALSQRNATDADSLLMLARVRRDAGDASELDVELASVFAGQLTNLAQADSLRSLDALLSVQLLMGLNADTPSIALSDTLALDDDTPSPRPTAATNVLVEAAEQSLKAAALNTELENRKRFAAPAISLGVEGRNPGGPGGALPLIGISLPIPLLNRNGAAIAAANAEQSRATAELRSTRLEVTAAVQQASRAAQLAYLRAQRSAQLARDADRITSRSMLAYREGASTLLLVLEAQRTARAARADYIDALADARIQRSILRLLTLTTTATTP